MSKTGRREEKREKERDRNKKRRGLRLQGIHGGETREVKEDDRNDM